MKYCGHIRIISLGFSSFFPYPYRGGRQRPELRRVLLGAAHAGPSLSQPRWLSESGAEGVGDGWPSLLGQMQPLKEERQRGGQVPAVHAVPGLRVADDEPVPGSV